MVFPFGVSVSDFIAGIKLFNDAIGALSNTRGARADYAELSRSLASLERSLQALDNFRLDTIQHVQALKQTVNACKLCLASFLTDIAKFQQLNVQHVSKARLMARFRQVQWSLCKKEDVRKFRSDVDTHIGALNMLLITFQVASTMRVDVRTTDMEKTTNDIATEVKQVTRSQAELMAHCQTADRAQTKRLSDVESGIQTCALEIRGQNNTLLKFQTMLKMGLSPDQQHAMFNMLQATFQQNEALRQDMKTLQTQNHTLLNHISDMKDVLRIERNLPAQVLLQQPVILNDALGRIAPFHLDFIDSVAAFLAVLQIRFEHVGRPKITRMEFDLRDTARQSPIALRKTWQGIFRPGQHVDMSMLFALSLENTSCPGCHSKEGRSLKAGESVQCQYCHINYRYGLGQKTDRIHFPEEASISDLLSSEEDDSNVSDFCRVSIIEPKRESIIEPKGVSIVEPKGVSVVEPKGVSIIKPKGVSIVKPKVIPRLTPNPIFGQRSLGIKWGAGAVPDRAWFCGDCGTVNSGHAPVFCAICGSLR